MNKRDKKEHLIISGVYVIADILKKSQAAMFKDCILGDRLRFSSTVCHLGRGRAGSYATDITIENLRTGEKVIKTFNTLANVLRKFHIKAIEEEEVDMNTGLRTLTLTISGTTEQMKTHLRNTINSLDGWEAHETPMPWSSKSLGAGSSHHLVVK